MRIGPSPRPSDRASAAAIALMILSAAAAATGAPVSEAASFYHQGRFDSALTRLEALKSAGELKRRDSLSLFQYLGMTSARLGRVPEAEGHFIILLGLDSLFQFPRNEDPAVLSAFARARAQRSAPQAMPSDPSAAPPVPSMGPAGAASLPAPASPATAAPSDPSATADPQSGEPGDGKPLSLAGMTLTESRAYGATGETGPAGRHASGDPPRIGLTMGAMPFGTGWFVRNKFKQGLVLGILQTGGLALSLYASSAQTREAGDPFRIQDKAELDEVNRWQWVQRVSLSTAVGAYIFSLIASAGD